MEKRLAVRAAGLTVWALAIVALAGALVVSPQSVQAQSKKLITPPVGLAWGWTEADLKKNGIKVASRKRAKSGIATILRLYDTPKEIAGSRYVYVLMTDGYGIQRVLWSSPIFQKDRAGARAKGRYADLKKQLAAKYGTPKSFEWVSKNKKFADRVGDFYKCMEIKGCGSWSSYWIEGFTGAIRLYVRGLKGKSKGYVSLRYQGPRFRQYLYDVKKREEKGAL
jgi:hypothetical protein